MQLTRDDWWRLLINHVAERHTAPSALWVDHGQLYAQWPGDARIYAIGQRIYSTPYDDVPAMATRLAALTVAYVSAHPFHRGGGDEYGWWDGVRTAVRYLYEHPEAGGTP